MTRGGPEGGASAGAGPVVLHLLEAHGPASSVAGATDPPGPAGDGASAVLAATVRIPGLDHRVWTLGTDAGRQIARDWGVRADAHAPVIAGSGWTARRALARLIATHAEGPARPDVIVAWSPGAALAIHRTLLSWRARHAWSDVPKLLIAGGGPGRWAADARRRAALLRVLADTDVAALGRTLALAWTQAGAPRVETLPIPHMAPSFDAGDATPIDAGGDESSRALRRAAARAALDLEEHELAVLLLGERDGEADTERFALITGMLHVAGVPLVGLVPAGTGPHARASRLVAAYGRAWDVSVVHGSMPLMLAASDVAVWDTGLRTAPGREDVARARAGVALAASAAASGLPVVARPEALTRELAALLNGAAPLLAPGPSEFQASSVLIALGLDPQRRRQVGRAGMDAAADPARAWRFHEAMLDAILRRAARGPVRRPLDAAAPAEAAAGPARG